MALCLVVDDEALHREIDCFAMQLAGFDTHEAANAEDALRFCTSNMPDIILLDLMMPGMNGLEFISQLRTMKQGDKPFVLMCSACSTYGVQEKAKLVGANNFLLKPFTCNMLKELLGENGLLTRPLH